MPGGRTCVGALSSGPVFSREQCLQGSFGGKPPIFLLTFAHAKTLFSNSVDLLVEFLSIIS